MDTVEGFECICLEGFTGSGRTCPGMYVYTIIVNDYIVMLIAYTHYLQMLMNVQRAWMTVVLMPTV